MPQLGHQLRLSSSALNLVSGAGNAGVYLSGPLLGSFVDARGSKPVLSFAAICLAVGYFGLAVMYQGGEDGLYGTIGLPGLMACQLATGIGGSAGLSASLKATSQSFPSSQRGAAMATVLACFGLSAFFYSSLAHAHLFGSSDPIAAFIYTLAAGCTFSMILGALFVRPDPPLSTYQLVEAEDFTYATPHPAAGFSTPRQPGPHSEDEPDGSAYSLHPALEAAAYDESESILDRSQGRLAKETVQHHAGELDVHGWDLLTERDFWVLFAFLGLCSGVGLMCKRSLPGPTDGILPLTLRLA